MAQEWVGFWATVAGVGTTLLGLAFLTFQLRAEHWRQEPLKHIVAIFTLCELGAPIAVSVIAIMPGHPWRQAAIGVALAGSLLLVLYRILLHQADGLDDFDRTQRRWSWLTALVVASFMLSAVLPTSTGLRVVGFTMLWLLVSGAIESWIFLAPRDLRADRPLDH